VCKQIQKFMKGIFSTHFEEMKKVSPRLSSFCDSIQSRISLIAASLDSPYSLKAKIASTCTPRPLLLFSLAS